MWRAQGAGTVRVMKNSWMREAERRALGRSVLLALLALGLAAGEARGDVGIDARRAGELVRLVRQDCGSCHGMTLKGGLGPPLTPEALRDKPASSLVATVLMGRPGTPMPPWQRFLTPAEAEWIVERLQVGFPPQ
jgi:cytochrome c55X